MHCGYTARFGACDGLVAGMFFQLMLVPQRPRTSQA
jgi:hypothetical protein